MGDHEAYLLQAATGTIEHRCTASIGVAIFYGRDENQNSVIDRADAAIYQAKDDGRNRIGFAPGPAKAG